MDLKDQLPKNPLRYAQKNNICAKKLFAACVKEENKNVMVSPFTIESGMSILIPGANHETLNELAIVFMPWIHVSKKRNENHATSGSSGSSDSAGDEHNEEEKHESHSIEFGKLRSVFLFVFVFVGFCFCL